MFNLGSTINTNIGLEASDPNPYEQANAQSSETEETFPARGSRTPVANVGTC